MVRLFDEKIFPPKRLNDPDWIVRDPVVLKDPVEKNSLFTFNDPSNWRFPVDWRFEEDEIKFPLDEIEQFKNKFEKELVIWFELNDPFKDIWELFINEFPFNEYLERFKKLEEIIPFKTTFPVVEKEDWSR